MKDVKFLSDLSDMGHQWVFMDHDYNAIVIDSGRFSDEKIPIKLIRQCLLRDLVEENQKDDDEHINVFEIAFVGDDEHDPDETVWIFESDDNERTKFYLFETWD